VKIKDSYFAKIWKLIKDNPKNMFQIVLFDFLFLVTAGIFYWLTGLLLSVAPKTASGTVIVFYLILTLMYYLILIFLCSFFKYLILDSLKSLFRKTKLEFNNLKSFYLLNLLIFFVFFMAFWVLNGVFLIGVREEYAAYVFLIISTPLFLAAYVFVNISHTLFSEAEKPKIKEIVSRAFNSALEAKKYSRIFLTNIVLIAVYFIGFYLIGSVLKATVFRGYLVPSWYYDAYTTGFGIITTLFFYFILFFNRVYFYDIINSLNKKTNKK